MKCVLTAIAGLLIAGAAAAQNNLPPCFPGVNGYPVGVPHLVVGQVGKHVFWGCTDAKKTAIRWYGPSCLHATCSEAVAAAAISAVTAASAKVATAKTQWVAHVDVACNAAVRTEQTERGALCRERDELMRANERAWLGLK